jgi:hypothetical protein
MLLVVQLAWEYGPRAAVFGQPQDAGTEQHHRLLLLSQRVPEFAVGLRRSLEDLGKVAVRQRSDIAFQGSNSNIAIH